MKSKHPFFCNCNSCKQKRKSNIFYLIGIIVVFIIIASIYCGVSTCSASYGLTVFLKSVAVVVFTIATMQTLLIPYYVYKLSEKIDDNNSEIDCVITMLHNLKNYSR